MKPDEKLVIQDKMKIDQKEFNVLKENQMVKLLIEVEKMSSSVYIYKYSRHELAREIPLQKQTVKIKKHIK